METMAVGEERRGRGRARILIVDDEPLIRRLLQRALSRDHDVTTASGGLEALALIDAGERFDVILCDLAMPVMTGMQLHAELEARCPTIAERMVFATGGACTARAAAFITTPGRRTILKPFDLSQLEALVAAP
jgi:CheY-like chemotaxis protein